MSFSLKGLVLTRTKKRQPTEPPSFGRGASLRFPAFALLSSFLALSLAALLPAALLATSTPTPTPFPTLLSSSTASSSTLLLPHFLLLLSPLLLLLLRLTSSSSSPAAPPSASLAVSFGLSGDGRAHLGFGVDLEAKTALDFLLHGARLHRPLQGLLDAGL